MLLFLLVCSVMVTGGLSQGTCLATWTYFSNTDKCLTYVPVQMQYDSAKNLCETQGGHAAMIKSHDDETNVLDVTSGSTAPMWIGLTNPFGVGFEYADGSPFGAFNQFFNHENMGLPCAKRQTMAAVGFWYPTECFEAYSVVCEASPVPPPPPPPPVTPPPSITVYACSPSSRWVKMDTDKCFMAYKGRRRFTFSKAITFCQSMGAELAKDILSWRQRRGLAKLMRFSAHFWIGYEDINADGVYEDSNRDPLTDRRPFKKYPPGPGKCLSFKKGKFFPKKCNRKQFVICQKPASTL